MEDVLERRVEKDEKGIFGLLSSEVNAKKDETQYGGLELVKDKEYSGGTSIKYWM